MIRKKCVVVVLDGCSDTPARHLGQEKTPLELGEFPNLDRAAREGLVGYIHSIGYWKIGGSDTSHLALLGYDPWKVYTGRGPIEVAGTGVKLRPGDVSIRLNYCTVEKESRSGAAGADPELYLVDRTASYVRDGIEQLADAINSEVRLSDPDVEFEFRNSQDYRCVVYFRGPGISANISDMDPSYDVIVDNPGLRKDLKARPRIVRCAPRDNTPEARHMADLLNEWVWKVHEVLDSHPVNEARRAKGKPPANCVMPRGAGGTPVLQPFKEKWNLKGACVAGTGLIKGIGQLTGMHTPDVPGATGYIDSDLMAKARATLECLDDGLDFILVHVESVDEVSHDKNLELKIKMIEKSDEMVGYLMDHAPDNTVICILSDHSTPWSKGDHTADPSPICIWAKDRTLVADAAKAFTEKDAFKGSLKHIEGKDLMPLLLNYMNVLEKFGS